MPTADASTATRGGLIFVRLIAAAAVAGVLAGLSGVALTVVLHAVQHVSFGYTEDTFLVGVEHASSLRRVMALLVGGVVVGLGWWLQRRWFRRQNVSVTHALTLDKPKLPLLATTTDALLQIVAVGAGASLGREGAPRQVGAALSGIIGGRLRLGPEDCRILLACGAGAGLAAVYNVPMGGAVFALEVLLRDVSRRAALAPAIVSAAIATVVADSFLGPDETYHFPLPSLTFGVCVVAVVLGICAVPIGIAFRWVMTLARTHAPHGWRAAILIPVAFTLLGVVSIWVPDLLGNGKALAQDAFSGSVSSAAAAGLVLLKPAATALCLRGGAIGGLLTPAFATGVALGVAAHAVPSASHVSEVGGLALFGAAAVLAVAQRAPWSAMALTIEFTGAPLGLLLPIALAVAAAKAVEHGVRSLRMNGGHAPE